MFVASVQRTSSSLNSDETSVKQRLEAIRIARSEETEATKQLVTDQTEVAKNCTPWGPKCQQAKDDQRKTETSSPGRALF